MLFRLVVSMLTLLLSTSPLSAQQMAGLPKAVLYDKVGRQIATSSISDFDNPVIVITYAEEWCKQCVDLITKLDFNYATAAKNSAVKIVAINVDTKLTSGDIFNRAKRWTNVEVLQDLNGDFQYALYTTKAPTVFFMNDHQEVIYAVESYNLDVAKAYKLADQIKRNLIHPEKVYFDKDWFPVPEAEGVFYRQLKRLADNDWEVLDYYKNGQLQMRGKTALPYPLVRNGLFSFYYQNGNLESEKVYVLNQLWGKSTGWFENGNIKYEYNYVEGLYDGKWISYYDNGKIFNTGNYAKGKTTGTWYHYYASGNKWKETIWKDGKREGRCQAWYENGKLKIDVVFDDDFIVDEPKPLYIYTNNNNAFEMNNKTSFSYIYENGQKYVTVEKVDDLLEINVFYENGKPMYRVTMKDEATLNGKYIVWYDNGNKLAEATLFNNMPNGKAMSWWDNGAVRERIDFNTDTKEFFDRLGNRLSTAPKEVHFLLSKGQKMNVTFLTNIIHWLDLLVKKEAQTSK